MRGVGFDETTKGWAQARRAKGEERRTKGTPCLPYALPLRLALRPWLFALRPALQPTTPLIGSRLVGDEIAGPLGITHMPSPQGAGG